MFQKVKHSFLKIFQNIKKDVFLIYSMKLKN